MNSRVKDDLVQSLKSFLPFEVVNPNPSNRYDKLLTYIKESDVPDNVNLFYPDKLALVGNLGIGTRNPVRGLHLEGDSGTSAIRFKTTGGEWDFAPFWSAFDDGNFALNRVSGSGNIIIPSGNVGIGVSNPTRNLTVSSPTNAVISVQNSAQSTEGVLNAPEGGTINVGTTGLYDLQLSTNNIEKMRITSDGNVGIGTTAPAASLAVASKTTTYEGMELITPADDASGKFQFGVHQSGSTGGRDIEFRRGGDGFDTLSMVIDQHGSVGIGTDAPRYNLAVKGNNSTSIGIAVDNDSGSSALDVAALGASYNAHGAAAGEVWFYSANNINIGGATTNTNDIKFLGSGSERMRITSSGNVGINQNNPTIKLEVVDTNNEILLLKQTDGPSSYMTIGPNNNTGAKIGYDNTDSADLVTIGHHTVGNVININSSGKVGIGETAPSDHHVAIREPRKGNVISHGAIQVSSTATTIDDRVGIVFNQTDTISRGRAAIMATAEQNLGYGSGLSFFTRYAIDGTTLQTTDERMRITSAGNVGIGTDVPDTNLHISGSGNVAGKVVSTDAAAVWVADSISTEASILSFTTAGVNAWKFQKAAVTGNLEIRNSADLTKFTMLDNGNVGIGVSNPTASLEVSDNVVMGQTNFNYNQSTSIYLAASRTQISGIINSSGGSPGAALAFYTNPDGLTGLEERMRITSEGNVGIGTSLPSSKLNVAGTFTITGAGQEMDNGQGISSKNASGTIRQLMVMDNSNNLGLGGTVDGGIIFYTSLGNERARILSSGGITFNGDTADANALDDYEEGTWTPAFHDDSTLGLSYSMQAGSYTKIGRLVYAKFRIEVNAKTGGTSGQGFFIKSLPFNIAYFNTTVGSMSGSINTASNITNVNEPEDLSFVSFSFNSTLAYMQSSAGSLDANSIQANTVLEGALIYHAQ